MRMTSHNIGNLPGGIIRRFLFPSGITSVGIRYRQNNNSLHGRPKKPQNRLAHVGRRSLITYHYSGSNHRPLQGSQFAFHTKKRRFWKTIGAIIFRSDLLCITYCSILSLFLDCSFPHDTDVTTTSVTFFLPSSPGSSGQISS
jgi:hypothetical protein